MNLIIAVGQSLAGSYTSQGMSLNLTDCDITLLSSGDALWSLDNVWSTAVGVEVFIDPGQVATSGILLTSESELHRADI